MQRTNASEGIVWVPGHNTLLWFNNKVEQQMKNNKIYE